MTKMKVTRCFCRSAYQSCQLRRGFQAKLRYSSCFVYIVRSDSPAFTSTDQVEVLIKCVTSKDCQRLRALHEQGADLTALDSSGRSLIHHAVEVGSKEIVKYIIDNVPTEVLDATEKENGETALHRAATRRQRTICHYLVEAGASLMKTDLQGDTPKNCAEKSEDQELADYLGNRQHFQMIQREDQETAV